MRLVSFSWAAERPLSHVVGIGRHWTIPPQPTHHLGHDRATEFLTVKIHAPGVVDVIAFLRLSFHEANILQKPVTLLIVSPISPASIIVSAVAQKYSDWLALIR